MRWCTYIQAIANLHATPQFHVPHAEGFNTWGRAAVKWGPRASWVTCGHLISNAPLNAGKRAEEAEDPKKLCQPGTLLKVVNFSTVPML
eukprot:1145861-Pelagomonas_calceolata.AAC.5